MASKGRQFKDLMNAPEILIQPGIYDGYTVRLAEASGFAAASISGAGVSESRMGWPDRGIMTFDENLNNARRLADCSDKILLRADALRQVDRPDEARRQYERLIGGCLNAWAHHGLGLVAARQGQLDESIRELQQARQALPTDTRVRNDLGYALLLHRQWNDAQFEFLTVLDLQANEPRAMRNLVLLALAQGKSELARQLAEQFKLDAVTIERLTSQARDLAQPVAPSPPAVPSLPPESAPRSVSPAASAAGSS